MDPELQLTRPKFSESKTGSSQQPASATSSKEGNHINVTEKLTLPKEQIERLLAKPHKNSDNAHQIYFLPYVLWNNSQGKWERETLKLEMYISPFFPPMAPVHASHFRKAATATFFDHASGARMEIVPSRAALKDSSKGLPVQH